MVIYTLRGDIFMKKILFLALFSLLSTLSFAKSHFSVEFGGLGTSYGQEKKVASGEKREYIEEIGSATKLGIEYLYFPGVNFSFGFNTNILFGSNTLQLDEKEIDYHTLGLNAAPVAAFTFGNSLKKTVFLEPIILEGLYCFSGGDSYYNITYPNSFITALKTGMHFSMQWGYDYLLGFKIGFTTSFFSSLIYNGKQVSTANSVEKTDIHFSLKITKEL